MNPLIGSSALLALLGPVTAIHAYAEVYMSHAQAAAQIFPHEFLNQHEIQLTPDEIEKIEAESGQRVRSPKISVWRANGKQVFIDQVLGKHEFITYAVGVHDGKVAGVEILEYRESYGQAIRRPEWRAQFTGKDSNAPLKLDADIKNISGATLSSAHITAGIKRILKTYDCIKDRL